MLQGKVFVGECFAVDGSTTGALEILDDNQMEMDSAYVSPCEITALQHKFRNHAVERASLVAESLLTGAKGAEVLSSPGDDIGEELEHDAALGGYGDRGSAKVS